MNKVILVLLALARPQWGFTWEEATQRGRDIIVAIDTSKSMLAGDIQPNRLERAKLAALDNEEAFAKRGAVQLPEGPIPPGFGVNPELSVEVKSGATNQYDVAVPAAAQTASFR